jgi:hypothetical protein
MVRRAHGNNTCIRGIGGGIIRMKSMESVTIRAPSCSIVVMGAGEHFLIATIMKDNADPGTVYRHLLVVSKEIGQVL